MTIDIRPQPAQEKLLRSPADIGIFGGGAGAGKSFALLMQPLRHIGNPRFGCVIFRRTNPMIVGEGGLWDKSGELYPYLKAKPYYGNPKRWIFPSGAKITISHMQYEKDKHNWDGQEIPLIEWDELDQFSETQFWYLVSRLRSTCGVRPYMRGSCNPNAESWLASLLSWWIDQETGYPIAQRSGVLRWFIRLAGKLEWGDSWDDLSRRFPDAVRPRTAAPNDKRAKPLSLTFVPALLEDNPILETKDPDYRAKLMALPYVERERLLAGNWKIRPEAGLKFPRDKWVLKEAAPPGLRLCRFWDKAGTAGGTGARTAGGLLGELPNHVELGLPRFWILHVDAGRYADAEREARIRGIAESDQRYGHVTIGIEREPGSGGKHSAFMTVNNLAGFDAYSEPATTNKASRWSPFAAQQQIGNVAIVKGGWDWQGTIDELDMLAGDEDKDKSKLRDIADALSGAFKFLAGGNSGIVAGDLLGSGDPAFEDEGQPLTDEEMADMPDFWRELVEESNKLRDDHRNR